jgi:hypothetical protein
MNDIINLIALMNKAFKQPVATDLQNLGPERIAKFEAALAEEVKELSLCLKVEDGEAVAIDFVQFADTLSDILVYVLSESVKWGIPILSVTRAVIASQETKLVDGEPVMSPCGNKWGKGPKFTPPDDDIETLLVASLSDQDIDLYRRIGNFVRNYPADRDLVIPEAERLISKKHGAVE